MKYFANCDEEVPAVYSSHVIKYLSARFPLHTQGLAILGVYLALQSVYLHSSAHAHVRWPEFATGGAAFGLLFIQLRLVDDIDDFDGDARGRPAGSRSRVSLRRLVATLGIVTALVILLSLWSWRTLADVLGASLLMFLAPVAAKRPGLPLRRPFLAILYEGAPALIIVYGYFAWSTYSGGSSPWYVVACTSALFWAGYEFWKFSRKLDQPGYRPYDLGLPQRYAALIWLLIFAELNGVVLCISDRMAAPVLLFGLLLPLLFIAWLEAWRRTAATSADARGPAWSGLTFVSVLAAGLLAGTAILPR
jgi:hypothetical protein